MTISGRGQGKPHKGPQPNGRAAPREGACPLTTFNRRRKPYQLARAAVAGGVRKASARGPASSPSPVQLRRLFTVVPQSRGRPQGGMGAMGSCMFESPSGS